MKDKHKLSKNPTKFTLLCLQNEKSIEKHSESAIVRVTIPHIIFDIKFSLQTFLENEWIITNIRNIYYNIKRLV